MTDAIKPLRSHNPDPSSKFLTDSYAENLMKKMPVPPSSYDAGESGQEKSSLVHMNYESSL